MKAHFYFIFLVVTLIGCSTINGYAYIDPGTGSLVVQAVAGAILIAGMTIKASWQKIKSIFVRK